MLVPGRVRSAAACRGCGAGFPLGWVPHASRQRGPVAAERRRDKASTPAAAGSTEPVTTYFNHDLHRTGPRRFAMIVRPAPRSTAPNPLPLPPNRLVPPITAAPTA